MIEGLSVILPNYNGKHLFEQYFTKNLQVFKSLEIPFEIIVVDDASTDQSVSYLKENFINEITLIEKNENSGFSKTCNIGIQKAKYKYTFLLNTDVLLSTTYFENIFKYFLYSDTFGVMGRIIGMNDDLIQDAARYPKLSGKKIKPSSFFYVDDPEFLTPTLYLSGAIALLSTQKVQELGGFNKIFSPFYGEDFELSLRAWRMGWKCYYHHQAICRHEISGSTKSFEKKYWIKTIYFRNRYLAHALHLEKLDLFLWHLQILFSDVILGSITFNFYKVKGYIQFLKKMPEINRSKRQFKELQKKHHSHLSLFQSFEKIKKLLKGKEMKSV